MIRYNPPRPIQGPDYLGATTAQGIAANQRYGQKVSQQNQNKSGLYGLGSTGLMKYGPALAKALSSSPTVGTIGTGVGGAPSMVAASSPEVAGFMSSGLAGTGGVSGAGTPVGIGAGGAGTAGAVGATGTAATGTAAALTAAEVAAAAEAAGMSTAAYLALMAV